MLTLAIRYRHTLLLGSLLLVVAVRPFLDHRIFGGLVLEGLLFVAVVAGGFATIASRARFLLLVGLATGTFVTRIAFTYQDDDVFWLGAFFACYLALFTVVAVQVLAFVLWRTERVTGDTMRDALSVYLLLGLVWFMAYAIMELVAPGSFAFGDVDITRRDKIERLIGFSYTTLTTLGYGNIAPATRQADALTTLEAMVGQIYVAIVIARLVALQLTQSSSNGAEATSR